MIVFVCFCTVMSIPLSSMATECPAISDSWELMIYLVFPTIVAAIVAAITADITAKYRVRRFIASLTPKPMSVPAQPQTIMAAAAQLRRIMPHIYADEPHTPITAAEPHTPITADEPHTSITAAEHAAEPASILLPRLGMLDLERPIREGPMRYRHVTLVAD